MLHHHILPERSFVLFDVEADASLSLLPTSIARRVSSVISVRHPMHGAPLQGMDCCCQINSSRQRTDMLFERKIKT
jgi:hypothetical protein